MTKRGINNPVLAVCLFTVFLELPVVIGLACAVSFEDALPTSPSPIAVARDWDLLTDELMFGWLWIMTCTIPLIPFSWTSGKRMGFALADDYQWSDEDSVRNYLISLFSGVAIFIGGMVTVFVMKSVDADSGLALTALSVLLVTVFICGMCLASIVYYPAIFIGQLLAVVLPPQMATLLALLLISALVYCCGLAQAKLDPNA